MGWHRARKALCGTSGKAYTLTAAGAAVAARLLQGGGRAASTALHPAPAGHTGLLLRVDLREGGGERHHLLEIMQECKRLGLPAESCTLPTGLGDYLFVYRVATGKGESAACHPLISRL